MNQQNKQKTITTKFVYVNYGIATRQGNLSDRML